MQSSSKYVKHQQITEILSHTIHHILHHKELGDQYKLQASNIDMHLIPQRLSMQTHPNPANQPPKPTLCTPHNLLTLAEPSLTNGSGAIASATPFTALTLTYPSSGEAHV